MLTTDDIKALIEAEKEVFATKEDIAEINNNIRTLQTAVDGLAKLVKDFRDEHVIIHKRLIVLEDWAKKVSEKVGISLPV